MSLKGSHTTAMALNWSEGTSLVGKLERDGKPIWALLLAVGMNTGLRISDILPFTWEQITGDTIDLHEKKTGKFRRITVNETLKGMATRLRGNKTGPVFVGSSGKIWTVQHINATFGVIKEQYGIKGNFTSHSLRKCFGRHVWEINNCSETALILLSDIFAHSGTNITRRYLGIRSEEIANVYLNL